jgi:hypothetical protein
LIVNVGIDPVPLVRFRALPLSAEQAGSYPAGTIHEVFAEPRIVRAQQRRDDGVGELVCGYGAEPATGPLGGGPILDLLRKLGLRDQ